MIPIFVGASASVANANYWLPQQWAFFSAAVQADGLFVFKQTNLQWTSAIKAPLSEPANAFGVVRIPRRQYFEIGVLLRNANPPWARCHGAVDECLSSVDGSTTIENPLEEPVLCGSIGAVVVRVNGSPLPQKETVDTDVRVARMTIVC